MFMRCHQWALVPLMRFCCQLCLVVAVVHSIDTTIGPARVSCNAAYNSPCSRVNAEWLATDTARRLEEVVSLGERPLSTYFESVTRKEYNMEQGFFPFVFDRATSVCVAHGGEATFVGHTLEFIMEDLLDIGFSSSSELHRRFVNAAANGGGWVQYIWKSNGVMGRKVSYVTAVTDQYFVGVGYDHLQLPQDLPCSDKYDSWCSINNVQSLVGKAQLQLSGSLSREQFDASRFEISFNEEDFQIPGGYYLFMYKFDGTLMAHAKLQAFVGQTLPEIFTQLNRRAEDGAALHQGMLGAATGEKDGWIQYKWRNRPEEAEYTKIAYVVRVDFRGDSYYVGCGYNHIMGEIVSAPFGDRCPTGYNLPCAFGTTRQLSSHALSHAISSSLSVQDAFEAITYDVGLKHDDYYVFVFDFNSTCVAHGLAPGFVGLTAQEVLEAVNIFTIDGDSLNQLFVTAATSGGGYVLYDWTIPDVPDSDFQKVSYIFQVTLEGRNYYGGVGFNYQRAPLQLDLDTGSDINGDPIPCSKDFGANCSEVNAQAILGQALADLVLASTETKVRANSSQTTVQDVLSSITTADNRYKANDFYVVVFSMDASVCGNDSRRDNSGCCIAHGGDSAMVGKTWQEILDMDKITSIRGEDLHNKLAVPTDRGGDSFEYILADDTGAAKLIRVLSSQFRDDGKSFYALVEYSTDIPPPTCDACPTNMECNKSKQMFCAAKPDREPFYSSVAFVLLCAMILGLPPISYLFCWVGKKRARLQAEAQILKVDQQMQKLRTEMEREKMTTAQTRKLVSSLFPENVQNQILEQIAVEEHRSSSDKLTSFLAGSKEETHMLGVAGKPIAELFPSASVIIFYIVGFTAWSSTREPSQVFQILESVYQQFDKLAKQRGVFKVESIGDSWVGVAGLPEKLDNHAEVMALFANDCLQAFNKLVKKMEVYLGPDTAGVYGFYANSFNSYTAWVRSSPSTGVLKTDKRRFGLFGDTLNIASRLESTGTPNMIHISQQTADLLHNAGKGHWYLAREEKIVANGKGHMQTYWLVAVSHEHLDGYDEDIGGMEVSDETERETRLVKWVTDALARILKQVLGQRKASGYVPSPVEHDRVQNVTMVLDEVCEIIHMPFFDGQDMVDPDDVSLDGKVEEQLEKYVASVATMYRNNAFHNFEHAAHVMMSVVKLTSRIVAPNLSEPVPPTQLSMASKIRYDHTYGITSDPLTQFACAFSALIHDVDHQGVPNTQILKEDPELAALYKGRSVAEQHSVDLAFDLLEKDCFKDLRIAIHGGDPGNQRRFRQLVVNGVMATDIMDSELKELRNKRWDTAFKQVMEESPKDASDRKATIVIDFLIQASDVAHTMQHWHVYRKWNERLFEEMYKAYLDGRSDKNPSSFWYKGELGFFDFYIIPLAKKLDDCGVFGVSSCEYLGYAEQNRQEWELHGESVVAEMVEAVKERLAAAPSPSNGPKAILKSSFVWL